MSLRTKLFTIRYIPRPSIPPVAARYLGSDFNCLQPKIAHMYATRDKKALWWRVSAAHLMPYKRVVRTWLLRRMRMAFQQALKDHGFDAEGKRIAPAPRSRRGRRGADNLSGTVEITINPHILREDISELEGNMHEKVGNLLKRREDEKRAAASGAAIEKKWVQLAPES